jgi:hypothetical protein
MMTAMHGSPPSARVATVRAVALALCIELVIGCGGGGGGSTTRPTTSTGPTASAVGTTTTATSSGKQRVQLIQRVRVVAPRVEKSFKTETRASAGGSVMLYTRVANYRKVVGQELQITIPKGPAKRLEVRAAGPTGHGSASATIAGEAGASIELGQLKYGCTVKPVTFCPVNMTDRSGHYLAKVKVPKSGAPIIFVAGVFKPGRGPTKPRVTPVAQPAAPMLKERVRSATPVLQRAFTAATAVRAGATVQLLTEVANGKLAAGRRVRIIVPRGPAKHLRVSAGGAGGSGSSTATIISRSGASLHVRTLRYTCSTAPLTFCPLRITETGKHFAVEGRVPASGIPIVLTALLG